MVRAKMKSVKEFSFPGKVRSSLATEAPGKKTLRNENTFVFTLNGLDPEGNRVHDGNKTGWIYCVCLRVNADTGQKAKDGTPVTIPKILCITSYYEYFELFFQILHLISSLSHMDQFDFSEPSMECQQMLKKLMEVNVDNSNAITIPPQASKMSKSYYTYTIPRQKDNEKSAVFFCGLLFSVLKTNDFFELMCNMFLEHSVVFVSENYNLLTSAMYLLLTSI